jgi:hypothetical protein
MKMQISLIFFSLSRSASVRKRNLYVNKQRASDTEMTSRHLCCMRARTHMHQFEAMCLYEGL